MFEFAAHFELPNERDFSGSSSIEYVALPFEEARKVVARFNETASKVSNRNMTFVKTDLLTLAVTSEITQRIIFIHYMVNYYANVFNTPDSISGSTVAVYYSIIVDLIRLDSINQLATKYFFQKRSTCYILGTWPSLASTTAPDGRNGRRLWRLGRSGRLRRWYRRRR